MKWLIEKTVKDEEKEWEKNYIESNYENVWSLTDDKVALSKIVNIINKEARRVLIAGCGSKTNVQRSIFERLSCEIFCLDWSSSAIEYAKKECMNENIKYVVADMKEMPFENDYFDYAIIVNSILSGSDADNRKMIMECNRVLSDGGCLIGFFPTILATFEIAELDRKFSYFKEECIDFTNNSFFEKKQNLTQIFYTPIRLRRIFLESSFMIEKFELFFCDTEYLINENERIYGLPKDSDLVIYEFFVKLLKKGTSV